MISYNIAINKINKTLLLFQTLNYLLIQWTTMNDLMISTSKIFNRYLNLNV